MISYTPKRAQLFSENCLRALLKFSKKIVVPGKATVHYFFAAAARFLKRSTRPAVSITFSLPV